MNMPGVANRAPNQASRVAYLLPLPAPKSLHSLSMTDRPPDGRWPAQYTPGRCSDWTHRRYSWSNRYSRKWPDEQPRVPPDGVGVPCFRGGPTSATEL